MAVVQPAHGKLNTSRQQNLHSSPLPHTSRSPSSHVAFINRMAIFFTKAFVFAYSPGANMVNRTFGSLYALHVRLGFTGIYIQNFTCVWGVNRSRWTERPRLFARHPRQHGQLTCKFEAPKTKLRQLVQPGEHLEPDTFSALRSLSETRTWRNPADMQWHARCCMTCTLYTSIVEGWPNSLEPHISTLGCIQVCQYKNCYYQVSSVFNKCKWHQNHIL